MSGVPLSAVAYPTSIMSSPGMLHGIPRSTGTAIVTWWLRGSSRDSLARQEPLADSVERSRTGKSHAMTAAKEKAASRAAYWVISY